MTGPAFIQRKRSFILSVALIALLSGISGCSTTDKTTTGSISPAASSSPTMPAGNFDQMNQQQLMQASTSLGTRYQSNPKDKATAINYATVLRMTNRSDQ